MYEYCTVDKGGIDEVNSLARDGWRVCSSYTHVVVTPSGTHCITVFVMERKTS